MIGRTDTLKGSYEKLFSTDGKVRMSVQAHGALTALTPYKVICNEYGPITAAIASDTDYYFIGVPEEAQDSGAIFEIQIGGPIDDVVTPSLGVSVGHGFKITSGAIADSTADFSGDPGEFAVSRETSVTSTTQAMYLVPEIIVGA